MEYIVIFLFFILVLLLCIYTYNYIYDESEKLEYADDRDEYIYPTIIPNLLSNEECASLIEYSKAHLIESEIVSGSDKKIRDSKQCWIPKDNILVSELYKKLCSKFNISINNTEDMQVVTYGPSQFYNEHHDSCCDDNEHCVDFVKGRGQRVLTVLIYLNEDFTEGETFFKNLDLKIKPNVGDAIVFYPLAKDSIYKCHPKALHAGLPIGTGQKWVANIWFRAKAF